MSPVEVRLIIVSGGDIASTNQADILLEKYSWDEIKEVEGHPCYSIHDIRMWIHPGGVLFEDNLDLRWQKATGEKVIEAIFPSRHSAKSGNASLTLHPIGVPQLDFDEQAPYGGKSGNAPPPSPRLASWWRSLKQMVNGSEIENQFDLSLEVTHHGPWISVPSIFVEVGSTAKTWGHIGAATILAELIAKGLGLEETEHFGVWDEQVNSGDTVLITLGGGHYSPRANKLGLNEGIWIGHMLATYALPFVKPDEEDSTPKGNWKNSINAAVQSTKLAFPNGNIICSMDKKAFKGWQRQAIREHLIDIDIPLMNTKSILELIEK
ncbi:MAG: D-aminoacyl-tRNA deacylase [Candidatus Poseidoniaceae archaeon]|nr:D-aminoacyl-tRNA deacylase [Candidatus Poseidoniaceae archaeon]